MKGIFVWFVQMEVYRKKYFDFGGYVVVKIDYLNYWVNWLI